jgi:hypothetical protein
MSYGPSPLAACFKLAGILQLEAKWIAGRLDIPIDFLLGNEPRPPLPNEHPDPDPYKIETKDVECILCGWTGKLTKWIPLKKHWCPDCRETRGLRLVKRA